MKRSKSLALIISVIFLLSACASFGPMEKEKFEIKLRQDVNFKDDNILLYTPASLTQGMSGYGLLDVTRSNKIQKSGVLVVSDKNIYFVLWKSDAYQYHWQIPYDKVEAVELKSFGLHRMTLVKFDSGSKVVSISAVDNTGQFIDRKKTEDACKIIAERSNNKCQLPDD